MRLWTRAILAGLAGLMVSGSTWAKQAAGDDAAREAAARARLEAAAAADRAHAAAEEAHAHSLFVAGQPVMVNTADGQGFVVGNRKGKKEKAAFLGVVATSADPAMRDQLKLPRGIGLVVQSVSEGTPAQASGLEEHDIILKLDDQWLVNSSQLGVLVRMHKADDEVTLTILRQGQQQTLKAKLVEKEMVIPDTGDPVGALSGLAQIPMPPVDVQVPNWVAGFEAGDADVVIKDGDQTLKISTKENQLHLVATDEKGQVLFDGPIETDEQRKAVPADIAEKLEKYKEQVDSAKDNGGKKRIRIFRNGK